jgi:putative pyruvate formate lyase activating enzyme
VCLHRGEEPVLGGEGGVCNVFFSHCNLQCVYCQNYQISRNSSAQPDSDLDDIVSRVAAILGAGAGAVGFVSPSHSIPAMKEIMRALRAAGRKPVFIMNTNAYDRHEVIESLEGEVDVYLPDFKYADGDLAAEYSGAGDYPEIGVRALREMYRQKGSNLEIGEHGLARSGLIIRHLVLPGHVENSIACLRLIAEELSASVHVSLMSQYHPVPAVAGHPLLGRTVTEREYDTVLEEFYRLGFYRGWVQEFGSAGNYLPDFGKEEPFGRKQSVNYSIRMEAKH